MADKSKSEADTDLEHVTKMADRLGLKGSERDEYIHRHMRGFGYKSRRSYFRPDDDDDKSGGFFGKRRRSDDDDDDDDE